MVRLPGFALAYGLALLVCAAGAACSPPSGFVDVDVQSPPAKIVKLDGCPRDASVLQDDDIARPMAGAIPDGFDPRRLTRCIVDFSLQQLSRVDRYTVREDRATPTQDILRILDLSDRRFANPRTACAAAQGPPMSVYLTDRAGNSIRVRLPRDPCWVRPEVDAGLAALEYSRPVSYFVDVPR